MRENYRRFDVNDPFGRTWDVEFRWLQNAISIRHADAVDCKYYIGTAGEEKREMVVALPHAALVEVANGHKRALTDAWCMKLAGMHLDYLISTWEDMEKTIVNPTPVDLARYASLIEEADAEALRRSQLTH